jgi:tripartite-type tricarboxylate transporter receptor subunit TctC
MFSAADLIGRPFVCPPGTPEATMNVLRAAFAKVAADPGMKSDAQKASMEVQYTSAKEIVQVIQSVFNQPPDIIAEFSKQAKF